LEHPVRERKFFFLLYSRRPRGTLLVKQEKIGIIDQKILSYSTRVKEEIVFGNSSGFQTPLEEFGLKFCRLGGSSEFSGGVSKVTRFAVDYMAGKSRATSGVPRPWGGRD
jgi:hypothetical protein